jgi:hypothetical protein
LRIEEAAVVRELSVAEEPRQHGQRARRQSLVDERLLAVQRLDGRATGQRVFTSLGVDDLGIQFAHGAQPAGFPPVARVQWLAENELAAGGIVAEIEPIRCAVPGLRQRPRDDASCRARVHAADKKIEEVSLIRSSVRSLKFAGSARHRVPQNRLMRLIRTVALFCPMSEIENGWRTQFVSETVYRRPS